jgi:glycerol uptake facilitator-like aquaporin
LLRVLGRLSTPYPCHRAKALGSLWLFWVAPIVGGVIGGLIARWLQEE